MTDNRRGRRQRVSVEFPRVFAGFWLGLLLFFILGVGASATLTYDLRLAGGGKDGTVQTTGQVVNLELYAVVTGAVGNSALEGFQDGYVSIVSSFGGNISGSISGTLISPFAGTGAQNGKSQDLDGDGDADLGSTSTSSNGDFLFARSSSMQIGGTAITNGQEFKLANITFTVTGIVNPLLVTPITLNAQVVSFTSPIEIEAVWQEDGVSSNNPTPGGTFPSSFPTVGASVNLRAIPEPVSTLLLPLGVILCAARRRRRSD
jgi:hypothetical protein